MTAIPKLLATTMFVASILLWQTAPARAGSVSPLETLAHQALDADATVSAKAIDALRQAGPEGLQALIDARPDLLKTLNSPLPLLYSPSRPNDPAPTALKSALDKVAAQYDAHASRLYWYTDLEKAKAAAAAQHKPILSLRLLGRLDEELSCANSRFFRTALYANADLSKTLREQFILHWESVRPVPKITIDFGDGRVMECTITGNSIHYVLDDGGRVIDALPGLYGPKAFARNLESARQAALTSASRKDDAQRQAFLRQYHTDRLAAIKSDWTNDLTQAGLLPVSAPVPPPPPGSEKAAKDEAPTAIEAAGAAVSKASIERPVLRKIAPAPDLAAAALDDAQWQKIAALPSHTEDSTLDQSSVALMQSKYPNAMLAAKIASGKGKVENPLLRMIANFQQSIALDTVRNQYLFHTRILQWLCEAPAGSTALKDFNDRVYAELFLTPSADPWLGLVPRDQYTALTSGGIKPAPGKPAPAAQP